jgi:hypothetical protein
VKHLSVFQFRDADIIFIFTKELKQFFHNLLHTYRRDSLEDLLRRAFENYVKIILVGNVGMFRTNWKNNLRASEKNCLF